jgi:hypothetical protein
VRDEDAADDIVRCAIARPTVEDIERLALVFTTSFETSVIRMVQLNKAPCAAMLAVGGRIKWAPESVTFPGKIVQRRTLHPASAAARAMARTRGCEPPREVPGGAWRGESPFFEHAIRKGADSVLSWIVPAETVSASRSTPPIRTVARDGSGDPEGALR